LESLLAREIHYRIIIISVRKRLGQFLALGGKIGAPTDTMTGKLARIGDRAMPPDPAAPDAAWDILGLGCVAVDDLLYVPEYPAAEAKVRIRQRERQCGGLTATALVAAARLGARCAFAGVLGPDEDSRLVIDCFHREGIDVGHLLCRPEARPIHSTIIVDESRHTRTIFFDLAGSVGAAPDFPGEDVIRAARVLYVDHYGIEGMTRAARIARAAARPVVADLERNEWPGFDGLLALVDHLIVSQDFATRLTGAADPVAALTRLWAPCRQLVTVTCGPEGCWYLEAADPTVPRHQPAFPVRTVDTTGCGDVFHGAYAAALARGLDVHARLRFAAAAAALKATRAGGQAGIPTCAATEDFLRLRERNHG
jgi:sugar/nucleoside kinase (ribokinase family)